jgi:TRAP-type C4-dicarboxylate transport system permease small subunit
MKEGFSAMQRMMKACNSALVIISSASMFFMVLIVIHGVFMRYVLHQPRAYSVELSSFSMMAVIACALAYTQKVRGNVRVDIVLMYLPEKIRKVLDVFTLAFFLLYAVGLLCAGWELTSMHFSKDMHSNDAHIPLWWVSGIFFIGLASLCLQLLHDTGIAIADLLGKIDTTDDEDRTDASMKERAQ